MESKYVERVEWKTIKKECGLDEEENNNGLHFGLHFVDFEKEGDILDTTWFKNASDRDEFIKNNNLNVVLDE